MHKYLNLLVILISIVTILSGLAQMLAPQFVLGFIGAEDSATASHFFAIVGMFMALFGGLMLQTLYSAAPQRSVFFWCAMQKIGASIMVGLGIWNGIFTFIAVGVAIFDLFSGALFIYYFQQKKHEGT